MQRSRGLWAILCGLLLAAGVVGCGGDGGGGGGGGGPLPSTVAIAGTVDDGTPTSPIGGASCRFLDGQNGTVLATTTANTVGVFQLNVPPDAQGSVRCNPPGFSQMSLVTLASTVGSLAGDVIAEENVEPATTVVANIIMAENAADPQARKAELLAAIAAGDPELTLLVEATTALFNALLDNQADIDLDGNDTPAGEGDGDGDGGDGGGDGADGDAGDGGEFTPIASALCDFSLDVTGEVLVNAALADLLGDGAIQRPDLTAVADTVNQTFAGREADLATAFASQFPAGLGQPLQTVADDETSATPGQYFLPIPPNIPGFVRCRPPEPEAANLVISRFLRALTTGERLSGQDLTPATTLVSTTVAEVLAADPLADPVMVQDDLFNDLASLQFFLSEDSNGNGVQDAGEVDEDGDGEFDTFARVGSDTAVADANLALLSFIATTIYDTMRIELDAIPADVTFLDALDDFFADGGFEAGLAPVAPATDTALGDAGNQAVLGAADVVAASTTGGLQGVVTDDESGLPVAGVEVLVTQNGSPVDTMITGDDGMFVFTGLRAGEVDLEFLLNGIQVALLTETVVALVTRDIPVFILTTGGLPGPRLLDVTDGDGDQVNDNNAGDADDGFLEVGDTGGIDSGTITLGFEFDQNVLDGVEDGTAGFSPSDVVAAGIDVSFVNPAGGTANFFVDVATSTTPPTATIIFFDVVVNPTGGGPVLEGIQITINGVEDLSGRVATGTTATLCAAGDGVAIPSVRVCP